MILLLALIHVGEAALALLRQIGEPIVDAVGMKPYAAFQSAFDGTANAGAGNYWKAHYLPELSDDSIDILCKGAMTMTHKESVIAMFSLGGAVARQPADSTPYLHRDANWVLNIESRWYEAEEDDHYIGWARSAFDAVTPFSTGGVYVNFISSDEGTDRVRAAYDDSMFERLTALKNEWDPDNVLHMNQNIKPS